MSFDMSTKMTVVKRRPNFTLREKSYLAELALQYRNIIEDKRTIEAVNEQKREAWKEIATKYNTRCETGPREPERLQGLYSRLKIEAKNNNGECLTNVRTKVRLFQNNDNSGSREDHDTNSSYYTNLKNLDQEPPSSPYHNATNYFHDVIQQSTRDPTRLVDTSLHLQEGKCDCLNTILESDSCDSQQSLTASPETVKVKKITKKRLSLDALKHLYLKKKCLNANLERKRILQEIAHAQEKHKLEMFILRKSLKRQ